MQPAWPGTSVSQPTDVDFHREEASCISVARPVSAGTLNHLSVRSEFPSGLEWKRWVRRGLLEQRDEQRRKRQPR